MKFIKSLLLLFLFVFAFSSVSATPYHELEKDGGVPVCIRINGSYIKSDVLPVIENGTTFVPIRFISEALGSKITYDDKNRLVNINFRDNAITIPIGSHIISINNSDYTLSHPAFIKNGRTMIPLRIISETFGADVNWDSVYYIVDITHDEISVNTEFTDNRSYDTDHILWLGRIIESESAGESMEGKIAVGNVVMNRVENSSFPNTIYGVIFDTKYGVQFEPVLNGTIYNTPSRDSVLAAKYTLLGINAAHESLYFLNPAIAANTWIPENRELCTIIGNHWFYY